MNGGARIVFYGFVNGSGGIPTGVRGFSMVIYDSFVVMDDVIKVMDGLAIGREDVDMVIYISGLLIGGF